MQPFESSKRRESGQAIIEKAIGLTIFMALVMGLFDLGRGVYIQNVLAYSAQKGARYSLADSDPVAIGVAVREHMFGIDSDQAWISVTIDADNDWVEVEVAYPYTAVTPFIAQFVGDDGSIMLRSTARMYR